MTLTVPCLFGLESLVADEMRRLDLKNVRAENGRVHCEGTLADIARLNVNLRCGARVLMELGSFPARDFEALFQGVYALRWEDYIRMLIRDYGAVHFVAGHDHHFGHKNEGNPELLQAKCRELGLGCHIIPKVEIDGITVSSTYIRTLVESGQMERAADFLGHRHCLTRTVTHGCRFGRTIGIPTVNLTPPDHVLLPERGVYVTRVFLPDGTSVPGVTNIGTRPTVSDGDAVSVETFLLDFDGDLYDKTIRVEFCRRLRPERRFASPQELKAEIQHNIQQTRDYFIENPE